MKKLLPLMICAFTFAALPVQALPAPQEHVVMQAIPTDVRNIMYMLQTVTETYAVEHGGVYPHSFAELQRKSEASGYPLHKTKIGMHFVEKNAPLLIIDAQPQSLLSDAKTKTFSQVVLPVKRYAFSFANTPEKKVWLSDTAKGFPLLPELGAVVYTPLLDDMNAKAVGYRISWLTPEGKHVHIPHADTAQPSLFYLSNI
jgi:hypothetical protein